MFKCSTIPQSTKQHKQVLTVQLLDNRQKLPTTESQDKLLFHCSTADPE